MTFTRGAEKGPAGVTKPGTTPGASTESTKLVASTTQKAAPPKPPEPEPIVPPAPSKPSGLVLALTRMADLEAQMEYAYVKHMQLVKRQTDLKLQSEILKNLPVGIDAIKDDLEALEEKLEGEGASQ